jgi:hypothetical protein
VKRRDQSKGYKWIYDDKGVEKKKVKKGVEKICVGKIRKKKLKSIDSHLE